MELCRNQGRRMMHIITPAFPNMNTTFNVRECQLKVIEDCFQESFKICHLIRHHELSFDDLLLEMPFFHDYNHFIEVEILSKDEKDFLRWKGLIQARLRYLVVSLETELSSRISFHLWPQEFDVKFVKEPEYKYGSFLYIGVRNTSSSFEPYDLTSIITKWRSSVYEQWEDPATTNKVYFFSKLKTQLDDFVYLKKQKGFYKYEGQRILFPQERSQAENMAQLGLTPEQVFSSMFYQHNPGHPSFGMMPVPPHHPVPPQYYTGHPHGPKSRPAGSPRKQH